MNTYSVKEIADMLSTNPETVRRWIRKGKLKAVQTSKKTGNVVDKSELERFLKARPKYSRNYAAIVNMGKMTPIAGVVIGTGIILSSISAFCAEKDKAGVHVTEDELRSFISTEKERIKSSIKEKEELISHFENEINSMSEQLKTYDSLLESNSISEVLERTIGGLT